MPKLQLTVLAIACSLSGVLSCPAFGAAPKDLPKQPLMGFEGTLVNVERWLPKPDEKQPSIGMRVDSVTRGSPAWKLKLERGDIVVAIDTMRFTTFKGYRQALRAASQRPSFYVVNVRTNKMTRVTCDLPHAEPTEADQQAQPPDSYLVSIDLADDMRRDGP